VCSLSQPPDFRQYVQRLGPEGEPGAANVLLQPGEGPAVTAVTVTQLRELLEAHAGHLVVYLGTRVRVVAEESDADTEEAARAYCATSHHPVLPGMVQ
jgi:hypothetical protein